MKRSKAKLLIKVYTASSSYPQLAVYLYRKDTAGKKSDMPSCLGVFFIGAEEFELIKTRILGEYVIMPDAQRLLDERKKNNAD